MGIRDIIKGAIETIKDYYSFLISPWREQLHRDDFDTYIVQHLDRLEIIMARDRELLNEIAQGLINLGPRITDLIDRNSALRARVVTLEAEKAGLEIHAADLESAAVADEADDLTAVQAVKTEFDSLASKFTEEPSTPDVEPLPDLESNPPAEPVAPGEPEAPVEEAPPTDEQPA